MNASSPQRRLVFILPALCFFILLSISCKKKDDGPIVFPPRTTQTPAPTPTENIPAAVWGYYGFEDSTPKWQTDLFENIQKDISWGLDPKTKPDTSGMVLIPAGRTALGCKKPLGINADCPSLRHIDLNAFYIDKFEISNAQYDKCLEAHQCLPPQTASHIRHARDPDYPALLTFKQAERFCLWAGKRLPTEQEWEKAARGADERHYPWGDDEPKPAYGQICGSKCPMNWADTDWRQSEPYTVPVGSNSRGDSPYGVNGMAGNVKEWVTTKSTLEPNQFAAKGASWYSEYQEMRVYYRQIWGPTTRIDDKGARCAADAQ